MGNYQRLLDEEMSRYEVVGFAEQLSGEGTPIRELGPIARQQAYASAGEFLHARIIRGKEVSGGDLLLHNINKDKWATLTFVVAESISIQPVTDTI